MTLSFQTDRLGEPRWGIVTTVKAEAQDILNFAAFHLEAGAAQIFLYLDAPCPGAMPHLRANSRIRAFNCNAAFWDKKHGGRPDKHQPRQAANATRTYRRLAGDLDWLTHIDADEFIWSRRPVSQLLADATPADPVFQIRPVESLGGSGSAFKAVPPSGQARAGAVGRIYPTFGDHLKSGFMSHTQGKVFIRTGLSDIKIRIHHAYQNSVELKAHQDLPDAELCHFHGKDWEDWQQHYRYRLAKGSYRATLKPAHERELGGVTMHELLNAIEADSGADGLKSFYQEVCADSPALRARLEAEGLLRLRQLELDSLRRKHFPGFC